MGQNRSRWVFNEHLLRQCLAERDRISGDHAETVGVRFERDRQAALPVPIRRFDACVLQVAAVDKYQTVRFDGNGYSVPRRWAFRPVTVKGYVDRIEVVAEGQVAAAHARSYGHGERILDPLHYLVTLEKKPAALDHAPVYRDWELPGVFREFRQSLEHRFGPRAGARQFIRVLQLLAGHPLTRVEQAICQCRPGGDAAAVIARVERLARDAAATSEAGRVASDIQLSVNAIRLAAVRVPAPDLSQFNRLLSQTCQGDKSHDATDSPLAAGQPEPTEIAHRAGRVREVGPRGGGEQRAL
jgi:hypothetical protein